jgi:DNA repair protein RadC
VAITRQLADAGRLLAIPLHDHLIIGGNRSTSLAERGLI